MGELRRDPIVGRWVVVSAERARRPSDYIRRREIEIDKGTCPFCPGRERMTPPASLAYVEERGEVAMKRDLDGERVKGWLVRAFPNLYPALEPPQGFHEVIVESPDHEGHPHRIGIEQARLVIRAYAQRVEELYRHEFIEYVLIFRNHGREAGASLSHAHSQLIATTMVPRAVKEELIAVGGGCPFCRLIDFERPRIFYENDGFVSFCPYASRIPFEFWIMPKEHIGSLKGLDERLLADALTRSLRALADLLGDPPYNMWIHIAPKAEDLHLHIEVLPKTSTWAGFELGAGIYINTMPPERACDALAERAG